jgi:methyltransferase (TIGR00027 family)
MHKNSPSETAQIVARNVALVAADDETAHLVSPETARLNALFVGSFAGGLSFLKRARQAWFRRLFHFYERLTISGLALHQALRKLHIEKKVRESLSEDFAQVVIVGGGFDTLALRLCGEFPQVNFLEIDHPATQKVKREICEKHNLVGANLQFLPLDLTEKSLAEGVKNCVVFRKKAKTVFVCEGVLMYLEASEVDKIFDFIKSQNAESRFVFTFLECNEKGKADFRNSTFLVRIWLKLKNEPFKWGLSENHRQSFFVRRGFNLKEYVNAETFRQIYLKSDSLNGKILAQGENIGVCERL